MSEETMGGVKRVYDKTKEQSGAFIRLPKELMDYIYAPKYKAEMSTLYGLISNYYNAEYGYAFPNVLRLAREYGKTEKTTRNHLRVLQELGLIKITPTRGNNQYVPYVPLNRDELFNTYPEARERYKDALMAEDNEKKRSLRNRGKVC